jgi:hypothetical protein
MFSNAYKAIIILCALLLSSCTSLVYSPSITLPMDKEAGDGEVSLAYETLPETDPMNKEKNYTNGIVATANYTFTSVFNMQAKYWSDLNSMTSDGGAYRQGFSFTGYFLLNDRDNLINYYIAPTFGVAIDGDNANGKALGTWFAAEFPDLWLIKPYVAVGFAYGWYDSEENGYGLLSNIGGVVPIYESLGLRLELSGVYQVNQAIDESNYIATPYLGVVYGF